VCVGLRSWRIGGQCRENEVLPKRRWSGRTALNLDVRPVLTRWTYDLDLRRTARVLQGNPIFTSHPIAHVSLL
jgi:hypothetical protein